jgi:hypothetical protein
MAKGVFFSDSTGSARLSGWPVSNLAPVVLRLTDEDVLMTVNISRPPETEARLRNQAAAAGKDVASLVREAIEEKLASGDSMEPSTGAGYEKWLLEFNSWVSSHRPVGHFVDDSRESIYSERSE